jgi:uncharacterized protein YcbK (DUF882 family)
MIKCYILDTDKDEKLGKYFHVREFACKDGTQAIFIDECLWTTLNILREKIGKPVIITSGYRTPQHNEKVKGAKYSYHIRGQAADIIVAGMEPKKVAKELDKIVPNECGIIAEKSWTHFDVRFKKYRKGV